MSEKQTTAFNNAFKIGSTGISEYTTEQIRAKAAVMNLSEGLTNQAVALAKDADFMTKAAAGAVTWGDALNDSSVSVEWIGDALLNSNDVMSQQKDELKKLANTVGTSSTNYKKAVENIVTGSQGYDDISDKIIDLNKQSGQAASDGVSKLGSSLKGVGATLAKYAPQIIGVTAAIAGLTFAFNLWSEAQHQYTNAFETFETASSTLSSTESELSSLNTQYDEQKSKIEELNQLKSSGTITMAQEVELNNLIQQNSELERQIELQQSLYDIQKQAAADAAVAASQAEKSLTEQAKEEYGTVAGTLLGLFGNLGGVTTDANGNPINTSAQKEWSQQNTTLQGQVESNIESLQSLQDELAKVQEQMTKYPENETLQKRQTDLLQQISDVNSELNEQSNTLSTWIDAATDEYGNALAGYSSQVDSWRDSLTEIANLGKSTEEIDLNNLNNLFNSTGGKYIRQELENIAKSGGTAEDALESLRLMGIDLASLDISENGFTRYFQDIVNSAQEAEEAINSIDGSVEGVQAAFESANQDADWNTMSDLLSQAEELYQNGKVGTDDFKSAAQFMAPYRIDADATKYDADAYVKAWEEAQAKVKRYFDEENPIQSMTYALEDLESKGLARQLDSGEYEWTEQFESSADAAEAFGLSVQATEAILHSLESYGGEFDQIFWSGEGLERYQTALDGLKSIRDSMESGSDKDRLNTLIKGWDEQYEQYENDISTLKDESVIVQIEFEYDLAQIQQQINELQGVAEEGGDTQTWAGLNAAKKSYRSKSEEGIGFNQEGFNIPVEYTTTSDSITALQQQLADATDDQKLEIQAEISNLYDLQNDFLDAFRDSDMSWDDFLKTDSAQESLDELTQASADAKQAVADILGIDAESIKLDVDADTSKAENKINGVLSEDGKTINMNVDASTEEVQQAINSASAGQTIRFTADVGDVTQKIEAVKNEDGTITYTAVETGDTVIYDKEANVYYTYGGQDEASDVNALVDYLKGSQEGASNDSASVYYALGGQEAPANKTAYVTYVATASGSASGGASVLSKVTGSGQLDGTAHLHGTAHVNGRNNMAGLYPIPQLSARALALGNLEDGGLIRNDWKTSSDMTALTGELGPEMVVHGNRWWTVGDNGAEFTDIPKGSVVFNAEQTRQLLANGSINSRGKAYLSGTALANGIRWPAGGVTTSGSGSSSNKSSSATKAANNAAQSASKAADSVSEAADEFKEKFDEIEILLDRMDRSLQKLTDSIETYSYDLSKQSAVSDQAMNKIRSNLTTLQQAYNRYIQEANSVGLDESWTSKIKDGRIDIETLTDEELKEKIDEYQQWLKISGHLIYFIAGTSPQPCFATT